MLKTIRTGVARRVAIAALMIGAALPASSETLAEALTSAYLNSGLLDQNRATLRAADEDVASAMAALRPVLSWQAGITRSYGINGSVTDVPITTNFGGTPIRTGTNRDVLLVQRGVDRNASISLILEQVIYAGNRNKLGIEVAKESVLATRAGLVAIEQEVLFRAVSAFMEMRRAYENVALRENNVRVIRQEVRAARDRFDVGEVTRTDVALAEARLAAATSSLAAAQGNLVLAQEEYAVAIGHAPGALVSPRALPNLPGSVDAAKAEAVRRHPEMHRVQHQVTAAELNVQIAEGAKLPTVSLRGTANYNGDIGARDFSRGTTLSLNAGGPIYSGGALNAAVRKAKAQRDATRSSLHVVRDGVVQSVGNAYVQLRFARASRTSFEAQVRAATVAFRGVREEAKLGARTTLDVLDAEQELLDARASLISSQVDEAIAAYAVLASMGLLTAESLQLDVPSFDPEAYYNMVKSAPSSVSRQGRELDRVLKALGKD
ncbi:TolC family outer membrane protein [Tropicibacter alexandrii]|uniref:TolC family outer membrane protein n=1 Tax=Tropicibacter alexandrii TaxID=2267683 RepID=UPI0023B415C1